MKAIVPTLAFGLSVVCGTAMGQYVPQTGGPRWTIGPARATTAAEGYARGLADLIRARGQAALDASAAAVNLAAARRMEMETRREWAKDCLEAQRLRREAAAIARLPQVSQQTLARWARQEAPERLSPAELHPRTGSLRWPVLLQTETFAPQRMVLERAFAARAMGRDVSAADLAAVQQTTQTMIALLQTQIREAAAADYVLARSFLANLAYEYRQPWG